VSAKQVRNIAASVRARLLNEARMRHRPFNEMLQYYAMERFLFRLAASAYGKSFLLKGALMLRAVGAEMSRPTMDIDLLGKVSSEHWSLRQVFEECVAIEVADGMTFDPKSINIQNIAEDADYHGVRIRFNGLLGTARIRIQIDISFGDKVTPGPMWVDVPQILDFGVPRFRACPPETAIAEKLQIMVSLEAINSRMKDFYDIYLMSQHLEFKSTVLAAAVLATFTNRGTDIPTDTPLALSSEFGEVPGKQEQWNAFVKGLYTDDVPSLDQVVSWLSGFLMPVLRSASTGKPFDRTWVKGGPWRSKTTKGAR